MLWEADHLTMAMLSAEIWGVSFQHVLFPEYIMEETATNGRTKQRLTSSRHLR